MVQRLEEMQHFIKIASSTGLIETIEPPIGEKEPIDNFTTLLEDLSNVVFKLNCYRELNEDKQYADGIEEGLSLAAEMISRIVTKYTASLDE